MTHNNKFQAITNRMQQDNKDELKEISLLEYVKLSIESNEFSFFTADTDEEVEQLNHDFIMYIEENYN